MATAVVRHRGMVVADHRIGNAEAGPSRHPNALIIDHHEQPVAALSRLRLVSENNAPGATLLDFMQSLTDERDGTPPTPSSESLFVKVDGAGLERRAEDRKGKTPIRPKKVVCLWEGCGKSFSKPAKLREHELSHTGEVSPREC